MQLATVLIYIQDAVNNEVCRVFAYDTCLLQIVFIVTYEVTTLVVEKMKIMQLFHYNNFLEFEWRALIKGHRCIPIFPEPMAHAHLEKEECLFCWFLLLEDRNLSMNPGIGSPCVKLKTFKNRAMIFLLCKTVALVDSWYGTQQQEPKKLLVKSVFLKIGSCMRWTRCKMAAISNGRIADIWGRRGSNEVDRWTVIVVVDVYFAFILLFKCWKC